MPEETISSPSPALGNAALNWADSNTVPKPAPPLQVKPVTPTVKVNAPPPIVVSSAPPAPIMTWTSLNRWASQQKIGMPHLLSKTPLMTFAVSSLNGVMILVVGSREATWNGVEIHLGFAPQIVDEEIFLHGLDLQKNLEPLLCAAPLTFGTNCVIVIDPGHGGVNSGTKSVLDGRYEKEFTLDWAKRLKPLLEADGWKVFLTRTNDMEVSLANRIALAESRHADMFISLHFNSAAPDASGNGIDMRQAGLETYCLTPSGMSSTLTRDYSDLPSQKFPNNAFDAQNLQLAVRLHAALLHVTGERDRGVRRARFMDVIHGEHCPTVLIEGGFLSNPHEAKMIETSDFRQKLAETVADALRPTLEKNISLADTNHFSKP